MKLKELDVFKPLSEKEATVLKDLIEKLRRIAQWFDEYHVLHVEELEEPKSQINLSGVGIYIDQYMDLQGLDREGKLARKLWDWYNWASKLGAHVVKITPEGTYQFGQYDGWVRTPKKGGEKEGVKGIAFSSKES